MAPELPVKLTADEAAAAVKPATMAYVTFLAGDGEDDGWKVGLARGLREVGSAYPLVVAVLPDVPELRRRFLVSLGCIVREVEPVHPQALFATMPEAYYTISKLRICESMEYDYERVVYLDAGIEVVDNIDELFELDKGSFYAVTEKDHTLQYYKISYCQCQQQQFSDKAAPPPPTYFNAGIMFVHEPGMATAEALLDVLRFTFNSRFAEQDLLTMVFRDKLKVVVHYRVAGHKEANMDLEGLVLPADADADEIKKKKMPWLAQAKDVMFARKNLPAMATLAAYSAAAGVVATAANPAICFGFYVVFMAAIAMIIISLAAI